jgi:hypothetical protein
MVKFGVDIYQMNGVFYLYGQRESIVLQLFHVACGA